MSSTRVIIVDAGGQPIASAQVTEQGAGFVGSVDLHLMPLTLRQQFDEYEEIVTHQLFSLLDDIEARIEAQSLTALFDDDTEAPLTDVQIYPSTKSVSFALLRARTPTTKSA